MTVPPTRLWLKAAPGSALQQGLELARGRGPSDEQLRDLERKVVAAMGVAGAVSVVTISAKAAPAASIATSVGLSAGVAKLAVGVALVALASGSAVTVWRRSGPPPSRRARAAVAAVSSSTTSTSRRPAARAPVPVDMPPPVATSVGPAPLAAVAAVARPVEPATRTGDPRAADDGGELRLLARAQRALAGDPALAFALAGEHEHRFSSSAMDQEREVIAVSALQGLGRSAEASRRAERFARQHPGSAYLARMRAIAAPPSNQGQP